MYNARLWRSEDRFIDHVRIRRGLAWDDPLRDAEGFCAVTRIGASGPDGQGVCHHHEGKQQRAAEVDWGSPAGVLIPITRSESAV